MCPRSRVPRSAPQAQRQSCKLAELRAQESDKPCRSTVGGAKGPNDTTFPLSVK
jgi:hypothetical protein